MARSNLEPGKPGPGRPPGSRNKTTVAAKEAIRLAAEGLGGADRIIAWAKEDPANERVFWGQIYTKLLPLDVDVEAGPRLARALAWQPAT
jgi:hypothetical protein